MNNCFWDFCPTPIQYPYYHRPDAVVVVVDVLRAGTSIVWALHHGARCVIPIGNLATAEKIAQENRILVGAERNAQRCPFAQMGNDPTEYSPERVRNREVALTTTNGTQAATEAIRQGAADIIVGSFANISRVADYLLESPRSVIVLASGWKNSFCTEDTFFAGALFSLLTERASTPSKTLTDSARMALTLYQSHAHEPEAYIAESDHYHRLEKIGYADALHYCLQRDIAPSLPRLRPYEGHRLCSYAFFPHPLR